MGSQYSIAGTPVPSDYVLTPGGFRPRSSVHRIEDGNVVISISEEDRLRPFTDLTGEVMSVTEGMTRTGIARPPNPDWITYAEWLNAETPISLFSTTWTVPQPPATPFQQAIFLYNALQDGDRTEIVQPVLEWGATGPRGGQFWTVACWYVDPDGNACFRDRVQVSPGDVLTGMITLVGNDNQSFNYRVEFLGNPDFERIALNVQARSELTLASETLEALRIAACTDYPASPLTAMTSIDLRTGGTPAPVVWTIPPTNPFVFCGQHTVVVNKANPGGEVDLFYSGGN